MALWKELELMDVKLADTFFVQHHHSWHILITRVSFLSYKSLDFSLSLIFENASVWPGDD